MRNSIIILLMAIAIGTNAQKIEQVDSIDMETGVIYPANNVEVVDTIDCSEIESSTIPQISFEELDSLTMSSLDGRYVVVYKDGKCGIYDLLEEENVTRIEYKELWFSFRREIEGEYYSYFGWEEDDSKGVIGVAEVNNQFVAISMPKVQDMNNKETDKEK